MQLYEQLALSRWLDPEAALVLADYLEERGEAMLLEVGKTYLVMTLTHYYTGKVVESTPGRTVLEDPAWIPDTGRLSEALATGKLNEVEPGPDGESLVLNTSHITNGWMWNHALPRKVK
ncbi:MAG: hypothetical protein IT200_17045 [Thermoleophilia bacterium]|nr:hypothetical protein [Thermoleophilia bacterium]